MAEIWNLSTLCRCCHADGNFKSLNLSYQGKNDVEVYAVMLRETLGITISTPPVEASYTICDNCIHQLRDATQFKNQVLMCEGKFKIYCTNELFVSAPDLVKVEVETLDEDFNNDDDLSNNEKISPEIKEDANLQTDGDIAVNVKNEYNIEVDIKQPFEEVKKEEPINRKTEVPKTHIRNRKTLKNSNHIEKGKSRRKLDISLIVEVATDNGIQFSCRTCGGCYQTKKEINNHLSKQHPILYKCEYCNKQLKSQISFENHLKLHTGEKFSCHLCPKTFCTKYSLHSHVNSHTKENVFKCDICQKEFKYKQTLRKHIRLHSGTNKKKLCDLCGNSFNDRTNLEIHVRTVHEKQKLFQCNFCQKKYTTKTHLRNHLKIHLGGKGYQCDICDHRLSCPKTMKIHKLKHENKYMCKFCSKIFDDPKLRSEHVKLLHLDTFPCDLCGKTFAGKYSLNRHIDEHKGIKRFSCDICGLKFTQKSQLNRHNFRKHNADVAIDEGKTKCDICKRSFKNIALHMDTHNIRKASCNICGKTYRDNSDLNRHKYAKHFGRTFDCDICGKTYLQRSKLNTHKMKVHKIKIEKDSLDGS